MQSTATIAEITAQRAPGSAEYPYKRVYKLLDRLVDELYADGLTIQD
jgi:hypothetical protein